VGNSQLRRLPLLSNYILIETHFPHSITKTTLARNEGLQIKLTYGRGDMGSSHSVRLAVTAGCITALL
jgi:hypothetical protein